MKFQILPVKAIFAFSLFLLLAGKSNSQEIMRANLHVVLNGTPTLIDGNLTLHDDTYSNAVDWNDAWKMTNMGENFGVLRDAVTLVIERRKLVGASDTTFFRMWNMQQRTYQIQFNLQNLNHPGLFARLTDSYMNNSTDVCLNGLTSYTFNVNSDPASSAQGRFRLIYYMAATSTIPVDFNGFEAYRKETDVWLNWKVENETTMDYYAIERSEDGLTFTEISRVQPLNNGMAKEYDAKDIGAPIGEVYYRIKGVSQGSAKLQYTDIVRLDPTQRMARTAEIYPNPVVNQNIQLRLTNIEAGMHDISLVSTSGLRYNLQPVNVQGSSSVHSIALSQRVQPGIYQLVIINRSTGERIIKSVNIL